MKSKPQSKPMLTDGHEANKQRVFLVNNVVHQSIGIGQVSPIFYLKVSVSDWLVKSDIGASILILIVCYAGLKLVHTCKKQPKIKQGTISEVNCISAYLLNKSGLA